MTRRDPTIVQRLEVLFDEQMGQLTGRPEWRKLLRATDSLYGAIDTLPFDARFNAVHWAFDVATVCNEIAYSYCWMTAYEKAYREDYPTSCLPAHVSPRLSFYADTCVLRLHAVRDKLALMVWAFYVPFNPENTDHLLSYKDVIRGLKRPDKLGLRIRNQKPFLDNLLLLRGRCFKRIEWYRHLKTHRREPRVEIHGIRPFHDWSYVVPLTTEDEIRDWEADLAQHYPDEEFRKRIMEGCRIGGVYCDHRKLKDRLWELDELRRCVEQSMEKAVGASGDCFRILRRRAPIRGMRRRPN